MKFENLNWNELQIKRFMKKMVEKYSDVNINSLVGHEESLDTLYAKDYETGYRSIDFFENLIYEIFKPELSDYNIKNEKYFCIKKEYPRDRHPEQIDFKYYAHNLLKMKKFMQRSHDLKSQVLDLKNYVIDTNNNAIICNYASEFFIQYIYECIFENKINLSNF